MTTIDLLTELRALDVQIWVEDTQLRVNAPKGRLTQSLRLAIKAHKAPILELLAESSSGTSARGISVFPRNQNLPLSFAQQRLWFLDQLEGVSATYNMAFALQLVGPLNLEALERAVVALVRRHEVLRTDFPALDGIATQRIQLDASLSLAVFDLRELTELEQEEELKRLSTEEASTPFDLSVGPLIRFNLLRQAEQESLLLLTMHHIISDGWSVNIITKELCALYDCFVRGIPPALPELPIQYADFALWQRQHLTGATLERHLQYWRKQLTDAPSFLEFPVDYPRPAVQSFRGKTKRFRLSTARSNALERLSSRLEVTPFVVLLATFKTLLFRYSRQTDIVVGIPIANRTRREIEPLVGFFANTLAMRTHPEEELSFAQYVDQVKHAVLEGQTHQDLPFDKLVEALRPERSLNHSPLFQVMFAFSSEPHRQLSSATMEMKPFEIDTDTAKFDLTLRLEAADSQLVGAVEYKSEIFSDQTIEHLIKHFEVLLAGIMADPNQALCDLPLLDAVGQRHMLEVYSGSSTKDLIDSEIHICQRFELWADRMPSATAAVFEGEDVTYAELNRRANQLAHYLRSLGVGPNVSVGICVERSLEMLVGVLGILKAGGAYLPLDPKHPKDRLGFMLNDARATIILVDEMTDGVFSASETNIISLAKEDDVLAQFSEENPAESSKLSDLAYVIHTSGSTGIPKGVMIPHSALSSFVAASIKQYQFNQDDRILQFASLNFDASVMEIFACLACGATLVLRSEGMSASLADFARRCEEAGVTATLLPTAFWHQLTNELSAGYIKLPPLIRLIIIGGEKALSEQVRIWNAVAGDFPLLENAYGPTEATVITTSFRLPPLGIDDAHFKEVPIGRPLANSSVYVLDQQMQPVPTGVAGELHIGGSGLALGYLNQPDLTARKFVQNPFDGAGKQLYKTGDLVRYLPDGNLEFIGRIDHQVKIRGHRIELGEIESVLVRHQALREVAVQVLGHRPEDRYLVAYFVPERADVPSDELQQFLKKFLPPYMIPKTFMMLESMPLSVNGKVDRKALPIPSSTRRPEETFVEPRNAVEETLAAIWADVLGVEKVGVRDDFFDLGGHSLKATQVVARVREVFDIELPLKTLFEVFTIEETAQRLEAIAVEELEHVSGKEIFSSYSPTADLEQGVQVEKGR